MSLMSSPLILKQCPPQQSLLGLTWMVLGRTSTVLWSDSWEFYGSARYVMVSIVGNGHGDMSSNPGRDWLPLT